MNDLVFVISPAVLVSVENESDLDRLIHPADTEWIQFNCKSGILSVIPEFLQKLVQG
jgi:hypothetical protein